MDLLPKRIGLFAISLLVQTCLAQSTAVGKFSEPEDDRSFYLNQPVLHPETLSGLWETATSNGGAVGIHLTFAATLLDDPRTPWTPQAWQSLEAGIFERKTTDGAFGERNGFSDSIRGGGLSFKDGRLMLHHLWLGEYPLAIDVDLSLQANGCWQGRFHRNNYDRRVSLCRPNPGHAIRPSPLAGTWSRMYGFEEQCVHIAETYPGIFTGWVDLLQIPGRLQYAPTIPGPHQLMERYGSLVKVEQSSNGLVHVEFGAYSAGCCQRDFFGKLNAGGSVLKGNLDSTSVTFARAHGNSCVP